MFQQRMVRCISVSFFMVLYSCCWSLLPTAGQPPPPQTPQYACKDDTVYSKLTVTVTPATLNNTTTRGSPLAVQIHNCRFNGGLEILGGSPSTSSSTPAGQQQYHGHIEIKDSWLKFLTIQSVHHKGGNRGGGGVIPSSSTTLLIVNCSVHPSGPIQRGIVIQESIFTNGAVPVLLNNSIVSGPRWHAIFVENVHVSSNSALHFRDNVIKGTQTMIVYDPPAVEPVLFSKIIVGNASQLYWRDNMLEVSAPSSGLGALMFDDGSRFEHGGSLFVWNNTIHAERLYYSGGDAVALNIAATFDAGASQLSIHRNNVYSNRLVALHVSSALNSLPPLVSVTNNELTSTANLTVREVADTGDPSVKKNVTSLPFIFDNPFNRSAFPSSTPPAVEFAVRCNSFIRISEAGVRWVNYSAVPIKATNTSTATASRSLRNTKTLSQGRLTTTRSISLVDPPGLSSRTPSVVPTLTMQLPLPPPPTSPAPPLPPSPTSEPKPWPPTLFPLEGFSADETRYYCTECQLVTDCVMLYASSVAPRSSDKECQCACATATTNVVSMSFLESPLCALYPPLGEPLKQTPTISLAPTGTHSSSQNTQSPSKNSLSTTKHSTSSSGSVSPTLQIPPRSSTLTPKIQPSFEELRDVSCPPMKVEGVVRIEVDIVSFDEDGNVDSSLPVNLKDTTVASNATEDTEDPPPVVAHVGGTTNAMLSIQLTAEDVRAKRIRVTVNSATCLLFNANHSTSTLVPMLFVPKDNVAGVNTGAASTTEDDDDEVVYAQTGSMSLFNLVGGSGLGAAATSSEDSDVSENDATTVGAVKGLLTQKVSMGGRRVVVEFGPFQQYEPQGDDVLVLETSPTIFNILPAPSSPVATQEQRHRKSVDDLVANQTDNPYQSPLLYGDITIVTKAPNKPVVDDSTTAAVTTSTIGIGIGAALGGVPAMAGAAQRQALLSNVAECPRLRSSEPLSAENHPLGFGIELSSSPRYSILLFRYHLGAIAGNSGLIAAVMLLHFLVSCGAGVALQSGFSGGMNFLRFPSRTIPLTFVLAQGSFSSAVYILMNSTELVEMVVAGGSSALYMALLLLVMGGLYPFSSSKFKARFVSKENIEQRGLLTRLTINIGRWIPLVLTRAAEGEKNANLGNDDDNGRGQSNEEEDGEDDAPTVPSREERHEAYIRRMGTLFEDMKPTCKNFFILEIIILVLSSYILALTPDTPRKCNMVFLSVIALFLFYTVLFIVLRPFLASVLNILFGFSAVGQTTAAISLYFAYSQNSQLLMDVSTNATLFVAFLQVLVFLYSSVKGITDWYQGDLQPDKAIRQQREVLAGRRAEDKRRQGWGFAPVVPKEAMLTLLDDDCSCGDDVQDDKEGR